MDIIHEIKLEVTFVEKDPVGEAADDETLERRFKSILGADDLHVVSHKQFVIEDDE